MAESKAEYAGSWVSNSRVLAQFFESQTHEPLHLKQQKMNADQVKATVNKYLDSLDGVLRKNGLSFARLFSRYSARNLLGVMHRTSDQAGAVDQSSAQVGLRKTSDLCCGCGLILLMSSVCVFS